MYPQRLFKIMLIKGDFLREIIHFSLYNISNTVCERFKYMYNGNTKSAFTTEPLDGF